MIREAPAPTFRDPAGSLVLEGDYAVRTIQPEARRQVLEFLESPFAETLRTSGDLIGWVIDESDDSRASLRLLHPRIPVPSYPWEWTPSQWLAVAELTLNLCEQGLAQGWILKDATPLNILFIGPRPILVDVLSFERHKPSVSIWLAYGQYIRTFLLPLLMNKLLHWPLALSLFHRDGYEPTDLYTALGWKHRLSPAAFWPITLPAVLDRRKGSAATPAIAEARPLEPEAALHVLRRTLAGLRRRTRNALPKPAASEWSGYTETRSHYTTASSNTKHRWLERILHDLQPGRVLDIGANTGEYSALAAASGAEVIALERDAAAAEQLFHMSRGRKLAIQTLHADISRPTPAVGWNNAEYTSLLGRLEGQFNLVLMLAVIHHLLLMEQIPLVAIMALCARLTNRYLVIEWVPVEDPMYQSLMRGREDLYGSLSESDLLSACIGRFHVLEQQPLDNGRTLFLLEKSTHSSEEAGKS